MCGIVGAVSKGDVVETLIEGLRRLEYRGYDSCGFAVIDTAKANHPLERARTTARVADLATQAKEFSGHIGIAHTRWATPADPGIAPFAPRRGRAGAWPRPRLTAAGVRAAGRAS